MELDNTKLTIWQENVNKSPMFQHDIISSKSLIELGVNIIALQEPAINNFGKTITTKDWTPIYPTTHSMHPENTRSIILVQATLTSNSWQQLDCPSGDITIIQLSGLWGKLSIFNIYNDCQHNQMVNMLTNYHHRNMPSVGVNTSETMHCIWLGDFNRHHPHWDNSSDTRLFTADVMKEQRCLSTQFQKLDLKWYSPVACQHTSTMSQRNGVVSTTSFSLITHWTH